MSSMIGNDETNKQSAVVTVVLYRKEMLKFVKYKISKVTEKFNKKSNRCYAHTLANSERLKMNNPIDY